MPPTSSSSGAEPGHRRPIAARRLAVIHTLAGFLARRRVTPNTISVVGLVAALVVGVLLAFTPHVAVGVRAGFLVLAAGLVQLRLLCNLIDGLVAVEGGMKSPTGDIFNEVPDRLADAAVLIGAGYAIGSSSTLGWCAALAAVMVAYMRAVGRSLGLPSYFCGPMAKQQRMFLVTVASVAATVPSVANGWMPWFDGQTRGVMTVTLAVIIVGCVVTFVRRLATVMRGLNARGRNANSE